MRSNPRRFKVQRRVDIRARDQSDQPFLFGVMWHTVAQADSQATAENIAMKQRHDHPRREFRLAEEWPIGSNLRPFK